MCFSTSASFGAGAVLSIIGILSLKKVKHVNQILFASIPLIFAVQQISEGVLWMTLKHPEFEFTQKIATYVFLFFAQILWPIWVPVSIFMLKKDSGHKIILKSLVIIGVLTSAYLSYALLLYPVHAEVVSYHIVYVQEYPLSSLYYIAVLYVLATIAPPFFSGIKGMWILGSTILLSCIITMLFYQNYLVSIWCFFASIISISVYLIINNMTKRNGQLQNL